MTDRRATPHYDNSHLSDYSLHEVMEFHVSMLETYVSEASMYHYNLHSVMESHVGMLETYVARGSQSHSSDRCRYYLHQVWHESKTMAKRVNK